VRQPEEYKLDEGEKIEGPMTNSKAFRK